MDISEFIEVSLNWPFNPYEWWENSINLSALFHWVEDKEGRELAFDNNITTYTIQLNSTFNFKNGWSASIDGRFMSDYLYGDQEQYLYPYLNAGVRKSFKGGASLGLSFQDLTNSIGPIAWEYQQTEVAIRTYGDNNWSERQVRITFSTPFGNDKVKNKRDRKTGLDSEKQRF